MKNFITFVCFWGIVICSCKTISTIDTGSNLTTLSLDKNSLNTLNEKMSEKKLDNINFMSLTLKKDQQNSECSKNQVLNKVDPSSSNNNIVLKTKAPGVDPCTYELYMEYGVHKNDKYTIYFKGKTTIGTKTTVKDKIIDNTYKGEVTSVQVSLTFIPEGTEIAINSNLTNNNSSNIKLIDLFDQKKCPFIADYDGKEDKTFLIKGDASSCINDNVLDSYYNKRKGTHGGGGSAIGRFLLEGLKLETNATYSMIRPDLVRDYLEQTASQTKRGLHNDTIDITADDVINIKYYPFKYTGQTKLSIGDLAYESIVFEKKDK